MARSLPNHVADNRLRSPIGLLVLTLSGLGFPLTQAVIAHWGRRGALVAEGVAVGLLARDTALVASGAPQRLKTLPRVLLWLELAAATASSLLGLAAIARPKQQLEATPAGALEAMRRFAVGLLFGMHTWRFEIYLSPDSGRR
jgi:hypothetical protein